METLTSPQKTTKAVWAGRIISGLCIAFFLLDAVMKIMLNHYHIEGTTQLEWNESAVRPIGIVLLLCTILYTIPRTALIGAILLTAYLGGAVSTMARINIPYVFPIIIGVLVWGGLVLRNPSLAKLLLK